VELKSAGELGTRGAPSGGDRLKNWFSLNARWPAR